jgi:hypothetical protein
MAPTKRDLASSPTNGNRSKTSPAKKKKNGGNKNGSMNTPLLPNDNDSVHGNHQGNEQNYQLAVVASAEKKSPATAPVATQDALVPNTVAAATPATADVAPTIGRGGGGSPAPNLTDPLDSPPNIVKP